MKHEPWTVNFLVEEHALSSGGTPRRRIVSHLAYLGYPWQDVETTEEDTVKGRGLRNARDIENV